MLYARTELSFPKGLGLDHTKSAFFDVSVVTSAGAICKQTFLATNDRCWRNPANLRVSCWRNPAKVCVNPCRTLISAVPLINQVRELKKQTVAVFIFEAFGNFRESIILRWVGPGFAKPFVQGESFIGKVNGDGAYVRRSTRSPKPINFMLR
ncbi:hypothetical protein AB4Z52_34795 [Rhizobium sp. 2YAF20]|uniref:hypothetical protein n=1 Tax=Rhizobium sp. 2YAF20 TaxID=3233027 RepID=UPI003F98AD15